MSTNVVQSLWLSALACLVFLMVLTLAPSDPALPEIVYDRHGNAYTQHGESVDCEVDSRC